MVKKKVCFHCKEGISEKEKSVLIETFNKGNSIDKTYFHFNCWKEFVSPERKTEGLASQMKKVIPAIKTFMPNIQEEIQKNVDALSKDLKKTADKIKKDGKKTGKTKKKG